MADHNESDPVTPEQHRKLAGALFNQTWTLLEKPDRTQEDEDRMVHGAHASRYHWGEVGGPVNLAVGEWQISRVYSQLGMAGPALHHARRCLDLCDSHKLGDFERACAHEALARAHAVSGDADESRRHATTAREIGARIEDEEDREILFGDLATLPL
jgi:hypothetical protein